jgi:hypothetical protein
VQAESESIKSSHCLDLVREKNSVQENIPTHGKISKPLFGICEYPKGSEKGETAGGSQSTPTALTACPSLIVCIKELHM